MCSSKPPKPVVNVQRPSIPAEPPAVVEVGSKRRREERSNRSRRLGTSQLRIDVNAPGTNNPGVNTGI